MNICPKVCQFVVIQITTLGPIRFESIRMIVAVADVQELHLVLGKE